MIKRFLFIVLLFCSGAASAQSREEESKLKAAFIYNFTKYIDWDLSASNEFTIGIIGSSPVYNMLKEYTREKTVGDKKIVVIHFNNPDEITACNILFISTNSSFSLSSILAKVSPKGTLTISEEPGFAEQGTALNFVIEKDKLKFEANIKSINAAGLKASSQLLKLARIVN